MPRGNRTGPAGMGPMSGRAAGYCAGFDMPGFAGRPAVRGLGAGYGWHGGMNWRGGRGWRHMFWATGLPGWLRTGRSYGPRQNIDSAFEKQSLKNHEASLQAQLDMVKKRLSELEATNSGD